MKNTLIKIQLEQIMNEISDVIHDLEEEDSYPYSLVKLKRGLEEISHAYRHIMA